MLQSAANQNRSIASGNRSLILCGLVRNDMVFGCLVASIQQNDKLKFERAIWDRERIQSDTEPICIWGNPERTC